MKHETLHHPSQTALAERHADLLRDIESVAERANAARAARANASEIIKAAEAALVRVHDAWIKSRGGNQNNLFFDALSKRLRRIIGYYRFKPQRALEVAKESAAARWTYRIIDYERIPFHRLAPWFRASAVDEAIKTGISLGLRELPGLRIWQENPDE